MQEEQIYHLKVTIDVGFCYLFCLAVDKGYKKKKSIEYLEKAVSFLNNSSVFSIMFNTNNRLNI